MIDDGLRDEIREIFEEAQHLGQRRWFGDLGVRVDDATDDSWVDRDRRVEQARRAAYEKLSASPRASVDPRRAAPPPPPPVPGPEIDLACPRCGGVIRWREGLRAPMHPGACSRRT